MATTKYLTNVSGKITEKATIDSSAGSGSAGSIASLDSNGKLDISFMPGGLAVSTVTVPAFESLTAGNFVNLFVDTSAVPNVLKARKATNAASTGFKQAHGYVVASPNAGSNVLVYMLGSGNNQFTGLTPGGSYYLATAGTVTATAPSTAGVNIQYLGLAISDTTIATVFSPVIETA